MDDYLTTLRNVGWVLIITGVLDVGYLIYCIVIESSYNSSFNVLAIIAGVFLLKGNLRAAWIVSWAMAFFISAFTVAVMVVPVVLPYDLMIEYAKRAPMEDFAGFLFFPIVMGLLVWIYRNLRSASVRAAMDETRLDYTSFWRTPTRGFWIGGCIPAIIVLCLALLMGGDTADQARQRAADQVGEGYKLHVKSLSISSDADGTDVRAVITAYNDTEIRDLAFEWSE